MFWKIISSETVEIEWKVAVLKQWPSKVTHENPHVHMQEIKAGEHK